MRPLRTRRSKDVLPNVTPLTDWKVAGPWRRLTAQAIDQMLVIFASFSALALWFPQQTWRPPWWATLILLWAFVSWVGQITFLWFYGNTPGKKAMGLVVHSARPHHPLTFSQILIRSFTWWLGFLSLGAGLTTILTRPDRRTWHDFAADTIVVAQRGEGAYASDGEKRLGQTWLAFLSTGFNGFLGLLLVIQIGHLSQIPSVTLNSTDLHAVVEKAEGFVSAQDEKKYLEIEIAKYNPESPAYFDLKSMLVRELMKSGDFIAASNSARNDIEILGQYPPSVKVTASARIFSDLACQAQALASCTVEASLSCSDPSFWSDWNSGCRLTTPASFVSPSQALGFWWSKEKESRDKFTQWAQWQQVKDKFKLDSSVGFTKSVSVALDFSLIIRTSDPKDVMEKARKILSDSPLWGWAQQRALDRFGKQWIALVSPTSSKLIARYKLYPTNEPVRAIASDKKTK